MDEDISDEEIGPSALRKAELEHEVNEHVRVTTPDEREVVVDDVNVKERVTPEEERVPSPLEQRVPSYHLENQGPSASEQQVPTPFELQVHAPFGQRVLTLEQQVLTPVEQPPHSPVEQPPHSPVEQPPHSPHKENVSPPLEEQISPAPAEQQRQQQDDARNVCGGMGPAVVEEPESTLNAGEEAAQSEELKMPGSFDMGSEPLPHQHSWIDLLRQLHLKQ